MSMVLKNEVTEEELIDVIHSDLSIGNIFKFIVDLEKNEENANLMYALYLHFSNEVIKTSEVDYPFLTDPEEIKDKLKEITREL